MAHKILSACLVALLTACGGGGDPEPEPAAPAAQSYPAAVIIGNSLVKYANQIPSDGWFGTWGMAASAENKDFAHLTAAAFGVTYPALRVGSQLEQHPAENMAMVNDLSAGVTADSLVVVELADNARAPLAPFAAAYVALLEKVKHARRLVCVSTWWPDAEKDLMIRTECEKRGGRVAYIGDLQYSPTNLDRLGYQFPGASVNEHPHDWGMAQIAARVIAAAR